MREWPLVGRTEVLRALREAVVNPGGRGLVLAGAAGVGKSRLAAEVLTLADRAGLATARVTATKASSGIPLGAPAPVLPVARHAEPGAVDDRADLLRRCAAALVQPGSRRLVLLVDDAHHLDDISATLVHQFAETRQALVLLTVRTGEPAPDAIVALWKDGLAERIELGGLTETAIGEVLSWVLSGAVDEAAVADFARRSRGNVLFLRELVHGALDDGALAGDGGIWRLTGELHPTERLVELVEARLAGLVPAERELLEIVSFAEPVGPGELGALADGDLNDLAERLERRGLLVSTRQERRIVITLGHPLYGEVLRARLPALRARSIARSLAEQVEPSTPPTWAAPPRPNCACRWTGTPGCTRSTRARPSPTAAVCATPMRWRPTATTPASRTSPSKPRRCSPGSWPSPSRTAGTSTSRCAGRSGDRAVPPAGPAPVRRVLPDLPRPRPLDRSPARRGERSAGRPRRPRHRRGELLHGHRPLARPRLGRDRGGNLLAGCETFRVAAATGERIGDLVGAATALHSLARVGHAKEIAARLSELAAGIEGELAAARAAHTRALADRDPEALETVSETFDALGADLLAAESAADAAVAWRRRGDHRAATAAERRAGWLASRCEGADTPALRGGEARARLTAAEWEAAQLAAAGRSNKQIAEDLVVSVRTIENRLQHVYGKLGISSRAELGTAMAMLQGARDPEI